MVQEKRGLRAIQAVSSVGRQLGLSRWTISSASTAVSRRCRRRRELVSSPGSKSYAKKEWPLAVVLSLGWRAYLPLSGDIHVDMTGSGRA